MMKCAWVAVAVVLCAACASNNSAPTTATVSCTGPVVKQGSSDGTFSACTIDAGTCSDGNTYVLDCSFDSTDTFMSCSCAVDNVSEDSLELQIAGGTCATAAMVTAKEIERAWLDCSVALTESAM